MSSHFHTVRVWDLPTRLFHWCLVAMVAGLWISGEIGAMRVHLILGPSVLALVVFRVIWGFVGTETSRFRHFVRSPLAALAYLRAARSGHPPLVIGHNPMGAYSVLALLGLLAVQATSGLFTSDDIATDGPLVAYVSSKTVSLLSKLHGMGFKLLLALIILHVCVVLFYTVVKRDNLILPMLNGHKDVPNGQPGVAFAPLGLAIGLMAVAFALVWGGLLILAP